MKKLGSQTFQLNILPIILHILLLFGDVDSALEEFPNNVVAKYKVGGFSEFKCKSDLAYVLTWFIQTNGTAKRQELANGLSISKQAASYCNITNEEGGEFNLILNIEDQSAQTYTCHEPITNEERSAELVIIDPSRFEKDVNESHVTLDCSVNFRGNWAPELELSHNGSSIVEGDGVVVVPNQKVSIFLAIPLNNSASAVNYSCTVRFDLKGKPRQTTDTSVPSYMEKSILKFDMKEIHSDTRSDMNSQGLDKMLLLLMLVLYL